jgi:hypothetical protein
MGMAVVVGDVGRRARYILLTYKEPKFCGVNILKLTTASIKDGSWISNIKPGHPL